MLKDKTVVIVEGEVLIALDIQRDLAEENANNIIFARSSREILDGSLPQADIAIVEIAPGEEDGAELARRFDSFGTPCILTSADHDPRQGLPDVAHLPLLAKPFSREQLLDAVRSALARRSAPQAE
ncbi:hypothetical protein VE25_10150 [Devosia geojensis]|uniref:Response regulatory domain-containing protein n=1 Tax=Devosia geojensis TaxID=443610 RepID=A0A0F5FTJ5_9HYPH|nr:response regulator [Devosia geojensis]KKB11905.1 hypothetical protein VE25_10150 [Devosia geojensis]